MKIAVITDESLASERMTGADYYDMNSPLALMEETEGYDQVLINCLATEANLTQAYNILKPAGILMITTSQPNILEVDVKITGFINITMSHDQLIAQKPNWKVGESVSIKISPIATKWKFGALNLDDDDLVDEDELLTESVITIPKTAGCGSELAAGKKRACKDCSCGLAEEEMKENGSTVRVVLTLEEKVAKAGSCGGCFKGDAFRCGGCPYLGLPAFEPGSERVMLSSLSTDL